MRSNLKTVKGSRTEVALVVALIQRAKHKDSEKKLEKRRGREERGWFSTCFSQLCSTYERNCLFG